MSNCLGIKKEKIKTPVSGLNGLSQNIKWKLKTIISNEDSSFAEPVDFLIVDKITEFTLSSSLDISNVEIPNFLTLADKSFYEANEVHVLISADIFFKVLKQNTYKVNEELFFKESEFGWIACGKLKERQINKQGQCFLVTNDSIQDTLKLFFDLEGLGIRDDPVLHERDQGIEIFKETVEFEKGRYIVQLPFRKSYNELPDNYPLAKQRSKIYGEDLVLIRNYISNTVKSFAITQNRKKENFNVHPVHETVSLGANGTKVLGLSWNTNEDYLTTDTKSLLEFVSLDKNTKRFILQAVGKIFDPLGLISPFTVRMKKKCLLQDLWKEEIQWDDPLPTHIEKEWKKWCEELPRSRNLKTPRLVLDSTLLEDDVELHSFCDASKKAYGVAIYLRTKSRNGISVKLVTSKSRVAPLNCVTLPRLELLGALVAARLASKVKKIVNLKRSCLQYHWTDSKIVLFWIKGNKTRWKQFVANRVNEITSLTNPHSWYHCAGAEFLSDSEFPKNFQQVVPELDYLTEHEKETVVQERKKLPEAERSEETVLLNSDSSSILDEILELSNNYFSY
ncbi:integrase catalytic domain-containing protein [Trichonephila clavipes]|nr:integrase catalytic domain-containing protein [Trichonephila clavipes]